MTVTTGPSRQPEGSRTARGATRSVACRDTIRFLRAIDLSDIRPVQGGEDLCFASEPSEPARVVRDGGEQHFNRGVAMQSEIARTVDYALAADAWCGENP